MPSKRSKSRERDKKRRARAKLTDEDKAANSEKERLRIQKVQSRKIRRRIGSLQNEGQGSQEVSKTQEKQC